MEVVKTLRNARLLKHMPIETEMENYTSQGSYAVRFYVTELIFNHDEGVWKTKYIDADNCLIYILNKNIKTNTLDVYLDHEEYLKDWKERGMFYFAKPKLMVRSFEDGLDYEIASNNTSPLVRDAYLLAIEDAENRLKFEASW